MPSRKTPIERWNEAEPFGDDFEGSPCMVLPQKPGTGGYVFVKNGNGPDGKRSAVPAHRLMYEEFVGPIPYGLTLDHRCASTNGLRSCVNFLHMEPVTLKENILRGTSPAAMKFRMTHCKRRGHELGGANTRKRGSRACRACRDEDMKDPAHRAHVNELSRRRHALRKAKA